MPDKPLAHPLKWWQFYAACVHYAGSGILGVIGDAGTILGSAVLLFKIAQPVLYTQAAKYLTNHGFGEDALIKIPLWVGGAILLARLCASPFMIYRDKPSGFDDDLLERRTLPDRLRLLSAEILQLVTPPRTKDKISAASEDFARQEVFNKLAFTDEAGLKRMQYESEVATVTANNRREAEILSAYSRTFAPRLIAIRDELRTVLPTDDFGTYKHPANITEVRAVAEWLAKLAERTLGGYDEEPEPSIVITYRSQYEEDPDAEEYVQREYLVLRNAGNTPVTKLTIEHRKVLDVNVLLVEEIAALVAGEEATVQVWHLAQAMARVRLKMPKTVKGEAPPPIHLKMTLRCHDWRQRRPYELEYAVTDKGISSLLKINRAHRDQPVKWTDLAALEDGDAC